MLAVTIVNSRAVGEERATSFFLIADSRHSSEHCYETSRAPFAAAAKKKKKKKRKQTVFSRAFASEAQARRDREGRM